MQGPGLQRRRKLASTSSCASSDDAAAWSGLCTDHLHNEWRDGRAVPTAILERSEWNPHLESWIRVAEEDEAMKIGPWIARKRKAFWEARFAVAVANCNAGMISRSQHITD